jgi:hypothetical protein
MSLILNKGGGAYEAYLMLMVRVGGVVCCPPSPREKG